MCVFIIDRRWLLLRTYREKKNQVELRNFCEMIYHNWYSHIVIRNKNNKKLRKKNMQLTQILFN